MTLPFVPYVNQIDNAPRKNECGLACCLMLSRWNGKGMTASVTALSQKYDAPDDGTSPANLVQCLKDMGLTPTTGAAAQYPYIELVRYADLPYKRDPNGTFLHWIVRLSDTEYHDPYWTAALGANLKTTKAVLDVAEVAAGSRVGIKERPAEIVNTMTKLKVLVDVRVRTGMLVADSTWTNFALKAGQTIDATVSNGWAAFNDSHYAVYDQARNYKGDTLYAVMEYNGIKYLQPDTPVTPPPAVSGFKLGVSVLHAHDLLEPAYQAGVRCFLIMDGAVTAKNFKRAHPDAIVMYRRFVPHGSGIPDPKVFAAEAGIGEGVVFVSPLNECDSWCYGTPAEIESRAKFDNALADMCRANGTVYAAGGFSMGTPDFTKPEICDAMKRFYAPGYNAKKYAMNWHTYSPTMGWIYGQNKALLTGQSTRVWAADREEDEVYSAPVGRDGHMATFKLNGKFRSFVSDDGTRNPFVVDGGYIQFVTDPIGQRIWFERRWEWVFDSCGFDPSPNLLGIYSDETGVDEGGVGGFPAHKASDADVEKWAREYVALQRLPLNGGPSVMRGAAIFQAGDTGKWSGYNCQGNFGAIVRANQ